MLYRQAGHVEQRCPPTSQRSIPWSLPDGVCWAALAGNAALV